MKVLYIGNSIGKITCGADAVNKRNIQLLQDFFSEKLIFQNLIESTTKDKLLGYMGGLTPLVEKQILQTIKDNNIQVVFISHSALGRVAKKIKSNFPDIKIITFYHNIEKQYAKTYLKYQGLKALPFYFLATTNEYLSVKYSDIHIVLNGRDNNLFFNYYGKYADAVLPVSYEDKFQEEKVQIFSSTNEKFTILFIGVAFFPNVSGITWFIDNVLVNIDAELIIIGKGMDDYFKDLKNKKVKVYGYVEDLSNYYYNADVVIAPIFTGGGMKTKIAEAMMYGKTILGTEEAFEGYDLVKETHFLFNTAEDCREIITALQNDEETSKFNKLSRKCFLDNYSNTIIKQKFTDLFVEISNK